MISRFGPFALEELKEKDLEVVRRWRNQDHVKRWMFSKNYISEEDQRLWFFSRKNREDFIFSFKEEQVGLIDLFDIDISLSYCKFGFYIGEKKYMHSGLGAVME